MPMSELEILAHIDREMLYQFVWSTPTELLAERLGVSVEAMGISCVNRGIPMPDAGWWAKVAAGMRPERPPLTKHRPGPQGTTGDVDDVFDGNGENGERDIAEVIDSTLGTGTVELIRAAARGIVIDPEAELRPCLRWQRDACRSEETLERWLQENELPYDHLWRFASPSSVARICAMLEAMGRAAETLGGTYDERGFDVFGEIVHVSFAEHLGKYRKGQTPSRTYNGLLSLYVGTDVYKDYRKKTLEKDIPMAFANVCSNAALLAKNRRDALEALVRTRAEYATAQAAVAAENERRKAYNLEVDRYEEALRLAEAHDRAEGLRRYGRALAEAGKDDEAAWVLAKADWADPVTSTHDAVFGDHDASLAAVPDRLPMLEYETRGVRAEGFFGNPISDPSPTLEAFRAILRGRAEEGHTV